MKNAFPLARVSGGCWRLLLLVGCLGTGSTFAQSADVYQTQGMIDLSFAGTLEIPHSSPSSTSGVISADTGYFFTRGSLLEGGIIALFNSGAHDVFVSGGYRYFFGSETSRLRPFVGVAVGANIAGSSGYSSSNFLAEGRAGVRYYVARHVAIEGGYQFDYVHYKGATFSEATASSITVGFAHVF